MTAPTTYQLMLFDKPLLVFTYGRTTRGNFSCRLIECERDARLPFRMQATDESLTRWVNNRTISSNRAFASRIARQYGITFEDKEAMLAACNGLSLNDAYWVRPQGAHDTFATKSLYRNGFDELVATSAFTGRVDSSRTPRGQSGELTTSGQFPKAWRIIDSKRYLYKAGAPAANGKEPAAEYLATQVAKALGISHISYDLDTWHGRLCSSCALFTSEQTGFATFAEVFGVRPFEDIAAVYYRYGTEAFDQFADMCLLDAVIANPDRHLNNFGFLFDNDTRTITNVAPVFDNNLSLFIQDIEEVVGPEDIVGSAGWMKSRMDVSLDYQASYLMTERLQEKLTNLLTFEFSAHRLLPLSDEQTGILSVYIRERARNLLALPVHSASELTSTIERVLETERPDSFAPSITTLEL